MNGEAGCCGFRVTIGLGPSSAPGCWIQSVCHTRYQYMGVGTWRQFTRDGSLTSLGTERSGLSPEVLSSADSKRTVKRENGLAIAKPVHERDATLDVQVSPIDWSPRT